jgi:hypothetical protein
VKWFESYHQRWGVPIANPEQWEKHFFHATGGQPINGDQICRAIDAIRDSVKAPSIERMTAELCRVKPAKTTFKPSTMPLAGPPRLQGCTYCRMSPGWIEWCPEITDPDEMTMTRKQMAYSLFIPCDCPAGQKLGGNTINCGYFLYGIPGQAGMKRANWQDALRAAKWQQGREVDLDSVVGQAGPLEVAKAVANDLRDKPEGVGPVEQLRNALIQAQGPGEW